MFASTSQDGPHRGLTQQLASSQSESTMLRKSQLLAFLWEQGILSYEQGADFGSEGRCANGKIVKFFQPALAATPTGG